MNELLHDFLSGNNMTAIAMIVIAWLQMFSKRKEPDGKQPESSDSSSTSKWPIMPANASREPSRNRLFGLIAVLLSQAGVALYLFGPDAHESLSKGDAAGLLTSFMLFLSGCSLLLRD